ncbi:ATP-binding protein [Streptomyces sp. NBC_01310]|uniref:sensor histidine kinase n=1 Tax=Streptomyces sp. NBC_01310 TaxID=2903820 RepID=UPI0035B5EEA9|nr:ATP-binding protein [Streptomyces sp. NBC_01310]
MSGPRAARHAPSRHAVTGPGRQIRPQLVRAAVLPTLAAGLSGAAAVIFTLQLGGGAGDRDARLWPVLAGCALLVVGALAAALLGAQRGAKAVRDRCEGLRRSSARGRQELRTVADRLERGESPPRPVRGGPTGPQVGGDPAGIDEFWLLSQELRGAREQAHTTLVRLAGPVGPSDSERKVEVFVNLARRLQSLVHREISLLDDLEDTVEDPDLLKELFHVDHLATRIRRHAENLAVLGGAASRRQWTRPIDLSEVLRSSVAEVEQYTRVKVVPPAGGSVRGHAVADVVHLLAELVENATVFSAPDTDVVLRAERVTSGIAVEVEDRGLGMPPEEQHRMNALLGDPDQISVRHLLADGRIGLYVVSALARRHGIAVELKSNIYGGVLAVLVLPLELLGAEAPTAADAAGGSRATSWGTGEGAAMPPLEPVRTRGPAPEPWPAGRPASAGRAGATAPSEPLTEFWAEPLPDTAPQPPDRRSKPLPGTTLSSGSTKSAAPLAEPTAADRSPASRPAAVPPSGPVTRPAPWPETTSQSEPTPGRPADRPASPASASLLAEWRTRPAPGAGPTPRVGVTASAGSPPGSATGPRTEPAISAAPPDGPWATSVPAPRPGTGASPGPAARTGVTTSTGPATAPRAEAVPGAGPTPRGAAAASGGSLSGSPADPRVELAGSDVPSAGSWAGSGDGAAARTGVTAPGGSAADPRVGPVGPGGERPALPRRRAQQHLAPQLREAPAPRRAADSDQPVHDPGLMAAFQRGFGLAQSENQA